MNELDCKKPSPCPPEEEIKEIYPPATEAFDFCAGNMTISWDGTRLRHENTNNLPDGEFGTVIIENGCIVGVGQCEVPSYTPPYCSPNPAACGDGSGSGGVMVSNQIGNTLQSTALGLYAKTFIQGGSGVSVSGLGTSAKPYIINASSSGGSGRAIISDNPHIKLTTPIDGATGISLTPSGIEPGEYNGLEIDEYGFVTGFSDEPEGNQVTALSEGRDIKITPTGTIYEVGHNRSVAGEKSYQLGAYEVGLNSSGHIEKATRNVVVEAGVYAVDGWLMSINDTGTITKIEEDAEESTNRERVGPIIDVIEFEVIEDSRVNAFGYASEPPRRINAKEFDMPSHVSSARQVTIFPRQLQEDVTVSNSESGGVRVRISTSEGTTGKLIIRS